MEVTAGRGQSTVAQSGSDKPDWGDERRGVKEARAETVWGSSWKTWMGSKKLFFFFFMLGKIAAYQNDPVKRGETVMPGGEGGAERVS